MQPYHSLLPFHIRQTLEQYCEAHPDSTFARDIAMNKDDIRNVTRRTLPNLWELHADQVCCPLLLMRPRVVHSSGKLLLQAVASSLR